jgi:hypothetical protein
VSLEPTGVELYLRLAGATLVVLLPGALVARALGRPSASGTLVWCLASIFVALLVVFAASTSLGVACVVLALIALAALPFALRRLSQRSVPGWRAVLVAGTVFGMVLWRSLPPILGDAPFHLGRVRKLLELDGLTPARVSEFLDGGVHPGYAFPLWHGFVALVSRIAGVDPAVALEHEAAVLAPIGFLVVFEAGTALFRSAWMGAAVLAAHLGLTAFASGSGGAFRMLALPATAGGRQLLVPAALALVFTQLNEPSRRGLVSVGTAGLVLAVVHPTYAIFTGLLLAGFVAARAILAGREARAEGVALAAFALPAVAFFLWLLPVVQDTASHTPTAREKAGSRHGLEHYPNQIDVSSPDRFRLAPEVIARAGAVPVAGLLLVPLAVLAARRRWAAFVLGGTVLLLALLVIPFVFPLFADTVTLSQARRAAAFLPLAVAVAGGAAVLARLLGTWALAVAFAAGIVLARVYPGDFGYQLDDGGPAWVVWLALGGGAAALFAGGVLRGSGLWLERSGPVAAAAAALFVAPIAVGGGWSDPAARPDELSPGLVDAVHDRVPEDGVIFSDPETGYWLSAFAPVYVAVAAPAHVADTTSNRPYERAQAARSFSSTGDLSIPRRYRADWIVVDRRRWPRVRLGLEPVYRDARYELYELG